MTAVLPEKLEIGIYGLVVAPVIHLANQHGIFDHLLADGPLPSHAVAGRAGLDPDTVERLLLVLTAVELLHEQAGRFRLPAEIAPFVDKASPSYVGGFVQHMVDETPGRLERLEDYLVVGKEAADAGRPSPYEAFYRDEQSTKAFMQAMWDLSYGISQELVVLAGLNGHRRVVDVGGANGPFSVAALQQHPDLHAVVFDLPEARPHLDEVRHRYGLADRLDFVAGDFFEDDLPVGDVIAMGYVMSNWPDPECLDLLRKAHRACATGGRVLLMERLFDDDRHGPISTAVMNLEMQVETRGRHRTPAEYFEMLTAAGFTDPQARRSSRDKHLILAHKPAGNRGDQGAGL